MKDIARLVTVLFVVIPLSALLYNSLELAYKIELPKDQYLAIQGYNNDISWLVFFEVAALLMTVLLVFIEKNKKHTVRLLMVALFVFVVSLGLYYAFILPANLDTGNWGYLPSNWESDRDEWEYINAARALLNLSGLVLVLLSFLKNRNYYRMMPNLPQEQFVSNVA